MPRFSPRLAWTAAAAIALVGGAPLLSATTALAAPAPAATTAAHAAATPDYTAAKADDLVDVRIGDVRPTQPSLGYDEVYYKLGRYSALGKDTINKRFDDWCEANGQGEAATASAASRLDDPTSFTCTIAVGSETAASIAPMKTVVIGPGGSLYLTDGHHTLTSFAETADGGLNLHVRLRVLGNLSTLDTATFWQTMKDNKWVWLRDVNGAPVSIDALPKSVGLKNFENDKYRSIMYFSRDIGFAADGKVPFQEFYWGSWLRDQKAVDLSAWDASDRDSYLATVKAVTEAQVALAPDAVVDSGYTASQLSVLSQWNAGKKVDKGEFGKLSAPLTDAKPGKLAYAMAYKATLPAPTDPTDPTTPPTDPTDPTTPPTDPTTPPVDPTTPPVDPTTPPAQPGPGAGAPSVTVSGELRAGGAITVTGAGFAPRTSGLQVWIRSTPQLLGTVSTDFSGAFRLAAVLPANLPAGAHTVAVTLNGVDVAAQAVTVAAARAADPSGSLAFTGSSSTEAGLALAAGLLLAGVATVAVVRRRRA
ncbi:ParB/Srx family N-terminal domain-containing protein [Frigoribacterium sp. 2-23]|uniref:ParB/Srx family N-terminal domain-containing protein n=1 Tax=Frigoribacterium sp. 2-23 TaxID=3415006 RepID=UPI003C6F1628